MKSTYKVGVLLSGCGVFDGSEIHESVFTLFNIKKLGMEAICLAPNIPQFHVINHVTGETMEQTRNVMVESARIARGEIYDIATYDIASLDAIVLPGGFGTAKNHTNWAINGANCEIIKEVKDTLRQFLDSKKPICGICMAPTTIAKALEGLEKKINITIGSTTEKSPYNIEEIKEGLQSIGATVIEKSASDIQVDETNLIITTPTYMMEADIVEVQKGIENAIYELKRLLDNSNK